MIASRLCLFSFIIAIASIARANDTATPVIPTLHTTRDVEGWTIEVDGRLLEGPDKQLGDRALRLLGDRLYEIKLVVPAEKLERLQQVTIWLDRTHGKLASMQYHPSAGWLKEHGYTTKLEKCVHIPDAAQFASPKHHHQQPWAVMHELAHAYHDQVLDFENAEIVAAWKQLVEGGRYQSVLHIDGGNRRHYALTNQQEFFAEMTEAYFGLNDFYPFHRAEMKRDEPQVFELLQKVWGPLP